MAHPLDAEIAAFESMRGELEQHHKNKFVIIKDGTLQGSFDTFDAAAKAAVASLQSPYLIRQVGAPTAAMPMPASVAYRPIYAAA